MNKFLIEQFKAYKKETQDEFDKLKLIIDDLQNQINTLQQPINAKQDDVDKVYKMKNGLYSALKPHVKE